MIYQACGLDKKIRSPKRTDFLVGVSGFEPEASWSRTKRDTKLRHTPLWEPLFFHSLVIILYFNPFVNDFFILFLKKP